MLKQVVKSIVKEGMDNPEVQQFILNELLINPIEKIVENIQGDKYRDVDTEWLDEQLEKFIGIAAETFGIKGLMGANEKNKPKYMDKYGKEYYLKYFGMLLDYFKSF